MLVHLGASSFGVPIRRVLLWSSSRGHTPELSGKRSLLEPVKKLLQHCIRDWDRLRRGHPGTGQGSPVVGRILCHLRPKPGWRDKGTRVPSVFELNGEQIKRPGRDEPLKEGVLAAAERHDCALKAHLADAYRQKRFSMRAWDFRPLLRPTTLPGGRENKATLARLDADEMLPVGPSWEVALDNAAHHALLLADQASQCGCNQKAALGHVIRSPAD
jgi:hypothetical protein